MAFSVVNIYLGDQLIYTILEHFKQDGRCSDQIYSNKLKLRIEETFVDEKSINLSAFQIYHLNLDYPVWSTEGANIAHLKCSHCGVSNPTEKRFKREIKQWTINSVYL